MLLGPTHTRTQAHAVAPRDAASERDHRKAAPPEPRKREDTRKGGREGGIHTAATSPDFSCVCVCAFSPLPSSPPPPPPHPYASRGA